MMQCQLYELNKTLVANVRIQSRINIRCFNSDWISKPHGTLRNNDDQQIKHILIYSANHFK